MKLALAGDTMLGRGVAEALGAGERQPLAPGVLEAAAEADLFLVNLECCISARGRRWPDPRKPFYFRAPPVAAEILAEAGIDCVTLANNHALDFGEVALLDTLDHLQGAGIRWVGAGGSLQDARAAIRLRAAGEEIAVVACSDHPRDFAAAEHRPGIAFADLRRHVPDWLLDAVASSPETVLVSPHWGPNMTSEPPSYVRRAAGELRRAGAALVAGHSAHVFHGAAPGVLFDLGDLIDDYAVDSTLRNDLGLLFLVTVEGGRARSLEAVPLKLDYCRTRLAQGKDAAWVLGRFRAACGALGTATEEHGGRVLAGLD